MFVFEDKHVLKLIHILPDLFYLCCLIRFPLLLDNREWDYMEKNDETQSNVVNQLTDSIAFRFRHLSLCLSRKAAGEGKALKEHTL